MVGIRKLVAPFDQQVIPGNSSQSESRTCRTIIDHIHFKPAGAGVEAITSTCVA
jgi:hypothetical protein